MYLRKLLPQLLHILRVRALHLLELVRSAQHGLVHDLQLLLQLNLGLLRTRRTRRRFALRQLQLVGQGVGALLDL